ncbi:MAG: ABC transporter ATP-binding protein [Elusimicrobiota bacterium]
MNKKELTLTGIKKSYIQGDMEIKVLSDIDLKFCPGKWYTIYGMSGSGKTTLLNIIGGLEKPDHGKVCYGRKSIYSMNDAQVSKWRNLKIGFVFQFFNLISEINVEENIILPLNIRNTGVERKWFDKIIDILEIKHLLNRRVSKLSGGEQQRVAMARAVINKLDFLLADEPTGNLDMVNSENVISLMKLLKEKSNVGIILATHEKDLMDIGEDKLHLHERTVEVKK